MTKIIQAVFLSFLVFSNSIAKVDYDGVRVKDLCRLSNAQENALVGYGIVTGLAGTGDSVRSKATLQSMRNLLQNFGVNVPVTEIRSRNAAAVMIITSLQPYSQPGDKLDINVTSLGDSRSLLGGTLLLTHLIGADKNIYALAQGPVSVGGFSYDLNGNLIQKNHPTAAYVSGGATVEKSVHSEIVDKDGSVQYNLHEPDFTTANKVSKAINAWLGDGSAKALDAARIKISIPDRYHEDVVAFLTRIESTTVNPDRPSRVVINERTGTVVVGGNVRISAVTITHGDLNVAISTEYVVSQPFFVHKTSDAVKTQVVPQTEIAVEEEQAVNVSLPNQSTVSELVSALNKVKASSRDMITILQAVKRAGALHAELVIQ